MEKIGFIGMGNMACALARCFVNSGKIDSKNLFAFAPNQEKLRKNAESIGFTPCRTLEELTERCDTLIMACKPYQIQDVLAQLSAPGFVGDDGQERGLSGKTLISVAAGWDFAAYEKYLPEDTAFQYIMPNTPAAVGKGVFLAEEKNSLSAQDEARLTDILESAGEVMKIPARLMDAATTVSGCGPAFFDMVIEALADGAVKNGVPRDTAYELVCHTMIGTAELMLKTGLHPGQLKDQVCSPGGTTIKGVAALEECGVRSAFIRAVDAVMSR